MLPKHENELSIVAMYQLGRLEQYINRNRNNKMCGGRSIKTNTMKKKKYLQLGWTFVEMPETRIKNARYGLYREHRGLSPRVTYKMCSKFYPV